jgi:hypothetical protein
MMGLLLSLIVAVAAFNIITSLGMMVMEKQGEVAILQTGADAAADYGRLYGAGRQRRDRRRAAGSGAWRPA